jgi:hypothetical protein
MDEEGCRNGVSNSEEAHCGGELLYWVPWVMKGRLWGWASLMGAQLGNPEWARLSGDFERWLKVALEVGCFSLWELCEGNLEGGLLCWGPWRIGRKGSGDGHLFP